MSTTVKPQQSEISDDNQSNRNGKKGKRVCWGQAEHGVKMKSSGKMWENNVIKKREQRKSQSPEINMYRKYSFPTVRRSSKLGR